MIKNYFKTAFRILTRNKVFSIINISGLSIALTSVIIIFLFISHELSFDKHFSNYNKIYRVVSHQIKNGKDNFDKAVPVPLGPVLKAGLTGVNYVTQIYFNDNQLVRIGQDKYLQNGLMYVDSSFVNVFDIKCLLGTLDELNKPNQIYLSENLAVKYFGSINGAINKELVLFDSVSVNVAGVIENSPVNTHIPYKAILSWNTLSNFSFSFDYNSWGTRMSGFATYLSLKDDISISNVENQIAEIVKEHNPQYSEDEKDMYHLQALKSIHLDNRFGSYDNTYVLGESIIWVFVIVGLIILIIAFINFTNLSIVQTIKRSKEVGIRKVLGADRKKLIYQFLGETFLLLIIAEIISIILTEVLLNNVNAFLGNGIDLRLYGSLSVIFFLFLILVVLTFLSGIYPALVLSRYNPIRALRVSMKIRRKRTFSLHNILVVFQFVISLVLIVSSLVVSLQINYFMNKDLGFNKENIVIIDLPQNQSLKSKALKNLLLQNPKIESISSAIGAPISGSNILSSFQLEGDFENDYHANVKTVDTSYYELYGLRLLAGEWFKNYSVNDSTLNIVVTKSLLKEIGLKQPQEALGKYFKVFGSIGGLVIGVVDDFHVYSLHSKIPPVIFLPYESFFTELSVKTSKIPYSEIKTYIEKCWDEIFPEYIYTYHILEETITKRYETEQRVSKIVLIFSFIAIVIACLGLYGLVSFMLVQRTKEIGIRKVLGSSIVSLVILVSKRFFYLVLISCVFAWPIAYYLMRMWLNNYAYKIDLTIWIFLLSGFILFIITFITIIYQSVKVSLTNPVEVLKYE